MFKYSTHALIDTPLIDTFSIIDTFLKTNRIN